MIRDKRKILAIIVLLLFGIAVFTHSIRIIRFRHVVGGPMKGELVDYPKDMIGFSNTIVKVRFYNLCLQDFYVIRIYLKNKSFQNLTEPFKQKSFDCNVNPSKVRVISVLRIQTYRINNTFDGVYSPFTVMIEIDRLF